MPVVEEKAGARGLPNDCVRAFCELSEKTFSPSQCYRRFYQTP
jgi:hypothetical protein